MSNRNSQHSSANAPGKNTHPAAVATSGSPATSERKQDIQAPRNEAGREAGTEVKSAVAAQPAAARIDAAPDAAATGNDPAVN